MEYQFELRAQRDGAKLILNVWGEVDVATAPHLEAEIDRAIVSGTDLLLLNMERVTFCDSSGINVLLHARRTASAHRIDLQIVRPDPEVFRVFQLVGLEDKLPFVDPPPAVLHRSHGQPDDHLPIAG